MEKKDFVQERHKKTTKLDRPRELIVACPPMRSNVNISRIVRAAGCCGVRRMICCGTSKVIAKIARDASKPGASSENGTENKNGTENAVKIENHRTLLPVLGRLREDGYELVGLEQTTGSESIFEAAFPRKMVLVVGNERLGIDQSVLHILDRTVEIPVYAMPYSHNAATATAMALYEYCRQFPRG